MSWKCFIVEVVDKEVTRDDGHVFDKIFIDEDGTEYIGEDRLPIGAMWISHTSGVWGIKLPGQCGLNRFCPGLEYNKHHWRMNGRPPNITVTPIIDHLPVYKGYVTDGAVSEDIEGRKFNLYGLAIV